uniref:non-specific serine/threonine protein kinase n=1 Tax=Cyprinus carpio TaxID=7962 RepID=A0A8C1RVU0_CYPCA
MLDNTENNNYSVHSNEQQESQHPISIVPPESAGKSTLKIKKKVITEEYKLAGQVLGIGINCKVWEIFQKKCMELHCRASSCPCIVGIKDVFENYYQGHLACLTCFVIVGSCSGFLNLFGFNFQFSPNWQPENLLYTLKHQNAQLKLTDFGFAKETTSHNCLTTPCYTPYYVVLGPEKYKSCDMWSLGVIINIMLFIRNGQYEFPHPEWSQVSEEGHFMVCNTSNGTFCSNKSVNVPPTHLHTSRVLKEESHVWDKVKEEMTNALATIRVDYEQIKIKPIKDSSNPLLLKRRKKMAAVMKEAPGP